MSWINCKLSEFCDIVMGQSPPSSSYNEKKDGLPFFQGKAEFGDLYPQIKKYCNKPKKIAEKNDTLLSVRAPVGPTNLAPEKSCIGRGLAAICAIDSVDYKFIFYLLRSKQVYLSGKGTGTTFKAITKDFLFDLDIAFPSLPEQVQVISLIEQLFSDLDNAIDNLKKAKDQIKVYRQALYKKAFEGGLTKEWRRKQDNLPAAKELLEKIKQERQKYYDHQLKEWKQAVKAWEENGENGKKPAKPRPLTVPDSPNVNHNERKWEIPENWVWTQIGTLCFVTKLAGFEYTDYVKYDDSGDLPVLKAENAGLNGFKKTDFSKVKSETVNHLTRSQLFGGELLIVFVGNVGNVAMVPFNQRYFLGPNVGMARPYFNLDSRYLELFLQSAMGRNLLMATVKAVTQPSLSMGTIRQTPVAFPSIFEQHQIVKEIESRLSVSNKMEETINNSLEQAEALRQSILKQAFEGKLTEDWRKKHPDLISGENSAKALLERIKKEREALKNTKKRKK